TNGMATDYGIMNEEMSILSGRKFVPGMNSRKGEKWKERLLGLHIQYGTLRGSPHESKEAKSARCSEQPQKGQHRYVCSPSDVIKKTND
nr:hypothetical protein [Tanacetum cinerariifolium]